MKHDPLSGCRDAVMGLIQRRQLRQHRIISVRHICGVMVDEMKSNAAVDVRMVAVECTCPR